MTAADNFMAPSPGANNPPETLDCRLRVYLQTLAAQSLTTTYQEAAKAMQLAAPHTIHQITNALEQLMSEDAAAGRPLIAAIVVSKWRSGLPAPGFFDCAAQLGRFSGDVAGPQASAFHAREFNAVVALWARLG